EAAGISKYRERRKETETRIRNTRENLERLSDVRLEIDKQLDHLKRQANAAERYKVLKQEQRQLRAQLHALHCKTLAAELMAQQQQINEQVTQQEGKIADQRRIEKEIEQNRSQQVVLTEELNAVQAHYYQLGADITRQEQQIHHIQERQKQLEDDLAQVEQVWAEAEQHLEDDKAQVGLLSSELSGIEPQGAALIAAAATSHTQFQQAEQQASQWQAEWERFQSEVA